MLFTIIVFIITLLILVVSHEFGHFIVAKKFGVKVLEFGFGLPPRIFGKRWGETLVSINWLPIGGFVKLLGEDETDKKVLDNKRSFAAKFAWQRILIVVAGVSVNLFLAVALFYAVLWAQGFKEKIPLLVPHQFAGVDQIEEAVVLISGIAPDSPASLAGIKEGESVVALNNAKIKSAQQFVDQTKRHVGQKVALTLENEGAKRDVELVPRQNPPQGEGPLGVGLVEVKIASLSYTTLNQKLISGFTRSYNFTTYSFNILGNLITSSFQSRDFNPVSQSVSGPVGLTKMTGTILQSQSPLLPYLNFLGLLSLNLAIINVLPIPALDGGRIFFLLIEAVFRKKVKAEVERLIHTAGMAFLIGLIILITFSDIRKFF